ncbi:ABC transporter permease [Bradyrhizobium sp. NC92]|uniref:ABC transporter permease n=1 Tax=Bradyrhizobium sp. (strain NC92) TaxID=55395 RepID=UPI0021AA8800|nr:ABC transporter permease [Bradyrhizobium sp. NC92]UWU67973.1 ABC transporter permease [Bradyrhizobium sp. NC92]
MNRYLGSHGATVALMACPAAFLVVFFLLPIAGSVAQSVGSTALDLSNYRRLIEVPLYRSVFLRTFEVALIACVICLIIGYLCAYFIASLDSKRRTIAIALISFPFMLSVLVRNYVWMLLLQDTGLINRLLVDSGWIWQPLELMYNRFAVVVAMVNMLLPYAILPILSSLLAIPQELKAASSSLGASEMRTLIRVTLPLTVPGAAVAALLTFIMGLGFYITPAMLGGTREMMVANLIAFNVKDVLNWSLAFALSTSLLASTLILYMIYRALLPEATVLKAV